MGVRKLYEVEVRFTYYAQAESASEAEEFARDAWEDGGADSLRVQEVRHADHRITWAPECLVYGTEGDVELGDLLAELPSKVGGAS